VPYLTASRFHRFRSPEATAQPLAVPLAARILPSPGTPFMKIFATGQFKANQAHNHRKTGVSLHLAYQGGGFWGKRKTLFSTVRGGEKRYLPLTTHV
jgi:hypothetical protein